MLPAAAEPVAAVVDHSRWSRNQAALGAALLLAAGVRPAACSGREGAGLGAELHLRSVCVCVCITLLDQLYVAIGLLFP